MLNGAQTTYAHQEDDGRDVQNFGMRPSPFNSQCRATFTGGSSARNGRFLRNLSRRHLVQWHQGACEMGGRGEEGEGTGNMDIVIEWPAGQRRAAPFY